MDRLQQAISKARQQREATASASPERAQNPKLIVAGGAAQIPQTDESDTTDQSARWAAFEPLRISKKTVNRNLLSAFEAGEQAIPFDMLRTKVLQQARKNNWKRVAVISPESGVGKTTIAANLAFSLGRMRDKRTVVVDLDLRQGGLANALGQIVSTSMCDVLEGRVSFAQHGLCHGRNVVFGLNGNQPGNASEIYQNPGSAQVLDQIEADYNPDLMIFDLPPLMTSENGQGFLQSVDCALLVVGAEKTPMDQIDQAERQLSELTNVLGMVLNRCRYTSGSYGYESDY